jgi:endo-1,4-beta-xylanase
MSGSYSLLTTTSSSGSGGPSIPMNTVLLAGAKYTITGWVQLTSGESASNANFTIKRSDPSCSGGTCYDTVGNYEVGVTDSGWAQIGGSYTVSATETGLTLYAQLVGATTAQSFYLDDVVITETAPPPGGTPIATLHVLRWRVWMAGRRLVRVTLTNAAPPVLDPNGDALAC